VSAELCVPAYAKINLALYVLGKRPDGFHDIATVLQAVDLHDTLAIRIDSAPLSLTCNDPGLATDESNLVTRAVRLLERECARELLLSIRLEKRIPVGAGLGGGSSDAAATLWAVNHLFDLGIGSSQLQALAVALGSDVPFFLTAGQALAEGRGEALTELKWPLQYHVLIAFPNLHVSSAEGYARARMSLTNPLVDYRISRYLAPENFWSWTRSQSNDLAAGVFDTYPIVAMGIEAMRALGAQHVGMTGSGSAVFGLFRTPPSAADLESWPADGTWLLQTAQPLRTPGCPMPAYGVVSRRG
jgi:4-diphosphocytidyl-2-C-methyl-D-erythritol kinase